MKSKIMPKNTGIKHMITLYKKKTSNYLTLQFIRFLTTIIQKKKNVLFIN